MAITEENGMGTTMLVSPAGVGGNMGGSPTFPAIPEPRDYIALQQFLKQHLFLCV